MIGREDRPATSPGRDLRLYNSRIIDTFIKYIQSTYENFDTKELLKRSGMEPYQVVDEGHWFTQEQVDAFYSELIRMTNNPDVARLAGRYGASQEALGVIRKYVLGLIGPAKAYEMIGKYSSNLTRSSIYEARRTGHSTVEITVTPRPGITERPFQCENRIGYLEAIASAFNHRLPRIEHTECMFRGGHVCNYRVTWQRSRHELWKLVRNAATLMLGAVTVAVSFTNPLIAISTLLPASAIVVLALSVYAGYLERSGMNDAINNLRSSIDDLLMRTDSDYENMLTINEMGLAISKQTDEDAILGEVVQVLRKRLDFDRGLILMANNDKTNLEFRAGFGYSEQQRMYLKNIRLRLNRPESKGVFVVSFRDRKPILVNDIDQIKDTLSPRSLELATSLGAKSFICCPIVYENESVGILAVDNVVTKRPLLQRDINLLMGLAPTIGISIRNARLFAEKGLQFRSLLQVLASTIDARDPLTAGHSEMVTRYAVGICREMEMPSEYCEMVRVASLLHDYGKIGTRDSILMKPGRLNSEEQEEIKRHVDKTEDILSQVNFEGIYREVPRIAGSHHELFDGSGYPHGLKGENIPLGSRIIAVADVFEALTSKRHYRDPIPVADAFRHLRENSGKQFDGRVVEAFISFYGKEVIGQN